MNTFQKSTCKLFFFLLLISNLVVEAQSGITWSSPFSVSASSFNNKHPRIVMDRNGNPLVLWGNSNNNSAMFSRWNGSSFTTPVQISPASIPILAASWAGPDIASKGDTVYVVFKNTPEDTSSVYLVRSFNGGVSFSSPKPVDNIADSVSRFPTVTIDANGNPIVAFMKFNSTFGDSRWVVSKSTDYGTTFSTDMLASGYSGGNGDVCDCCPGAIVCSSNKVAMLYRDNLSNIRDMWTGISTDNGNTFPNGIGIDQHNWYLTSCPSSGPDAVIVDDTLYSVFMNGASGKSLVYSNKNSLSTLVSSTGNAITGNFAGLSQQNFPRIDNYSTAVAEVWKQVTSAGTQVALLFTPNIHTGFPALYDTVSMGTAASAANADVAVYNGAVYVVWEDDNSGTVKYRKGMFTPINTGISNPSDNSQILIYPNPTNSFVAVEFSDSKFQNAEYKIVNILGELLQAGYLNDLKNIISISSLPEGIYFLQVKSKNDYSIKKIIMKR